MKILNDPKVRALLNSTPVDFEKLYNLGIYCYWIFAFTGGILAIINGFQHNTFGFYACLFASGVCCLAIEFLVNKKNEIKRRLNG